MKQKVLLFLAALLLPAAASAYDACINGIYYNIVKKAKQATVTYGESESGTYSGNVNIPSTVEYDGVTCNVIAIGEKAFQGCTLESLTIPASVTSIEDNAFATEISKLYITDLAAWCSNIQFGEWGCYPLEKAEHLYINDKETTDLVIPNGVSKISNYAFYGAKMLNTITIPGSVTEIGSHAFYYYNHDLAKVTIENKSLVTIGEDAFPVGQIKEMHITDLAAWCSNISVTFFSNPITQSEKLFVNGKEIKELKIPDGVTKISYCAFYGAKMLTSVHIPNSVTEIGTHAFSSCTALEKVVLGDGVIVVDWVFNNCDKLKELTIGRNVRKLIMYSPELEKLENVYISDLTGFCKIITDERNGSSRDPFHRMPPKQTTIKASSNSVKPRLFLNGQEVKNLVVPKDIFETTEDMVYFVSGSDIFYCICDAFSGIASLESVTIPKETVPAGIDCYTGFRNCPNLKSLKSETNLTQMGIANCEKLEMLSFGKYTKSVSVYNCKELADVYCAALPGKASFGEDCQVEYATLHVPEILIEKYRNYSMGNNITWKDFGSIVALKPGDPGYVANPDNTAITFADAAFGAAAIAAFDFDGDGKLSKYEASLVTDFGKAFKGNTSIKSLDDLKYFTSLQTINADAFLNCTGLTSVTIPNSVISIGGGAFLGTGITSVRIPNSVKRIGERAFANIKSHPSVYITDLEAWCRVYFDNNYSPFDNSPYSLYLNGEEVTDLTIPNSINHIGNKTFSYCASLTSVTIPNSVTSIGDGAFQYCSALTSATIPNSVKSIGQESFVHCDALASISFSCSETEISNQAFAYCNNLKKVQIMDLNAWCKLSFELLSINMDYLSNPLCNGGNLFLNGKELTNLVIPSSVTSIKSGAFYGGGMTSITIPNSVTSIGYKSFYGCRKLEKIYSKIEEPFAIDDNLFNYYYWGEHSSSATLYVPRGTKAKYQATDGWKNFQTIIETDFKDEPQGDVNGDNVVDVADIASVISVMASGSGLANPLQQAADVNGDGVVDVADIATIISMMAAQARMQE